MTSHATEGQKPDLYGQVHPIETPELIQSSLVAMKEELEKIPDDEKRNANQAQEKCPFLVKDDFKLMFLRSEVFNADLAAKRYVHYWDKRVELFGPEKAFLPLTLDGALKDDTVALDFGLSSPVVGKKDATGRGIIFADPSKQDKSKYPRESMARAFWYMMHAVLEDEEAQQKGIVLLIYPHHAKLSQFDRALVKMNLDSIKGAIPVRLSAGHICHPPPFLYLVLPVFKLFMGPRLRKRIQLHSGKTDKFLADMAKWGLPKEVIPSDLGGDVVMDHQAWLESRRAAGK